MTKREQVAAMILDHDEGGKSLEWAAEFIAKCADEPHGGDCGKCPPEMQAPITCSRCVCDDALAAADRIIEFLNQ